MSKIITLTGIATLLLAPFGAFALNFSAITAAICMGSEAHEDPARRYTAAVSCGLICIVIGIFGAAITGLLTAFPRELVVAIAGLALLGTIGGGLLGRGGRRRGAVCTTIRASTQPGIPAGADRNRLDLQVKNQSMTPP